MRLSPLGILPLIVLALPAAGQVAPTPTPVPTATPVVSLSANSLHFTGRGLVAAYEKGLGRLTGFPADRLGCTKASCHVQSCDECHRDGAAGKASYSVKRARDPKVCAPCHGDPDPKDTDVHVRAGMACMDCHTAREVHGDGTAYESAWQPDAMDVRCESCHGTIGRTRSHEVHAGKLACPACHTREVDTCFNCHVDSRLNGIRDASIKRTGLVFLVNHRGRVTLGNLLTYVYGDRTAITLAPVYPHKIVKEARRCPECHETQIARDVAAGSLVLSRFEGGELKTVTGVVPVVEGMAWNLAFLGREGRTWVPLADPKPPLVTFNGFCSPLTREQLGKLARR